MRCPYCHDTIAGGPSRTCGVCRARTHRACATELGACATCGRGWPEALGGVGWTLACAPALHWALRATTGPALDVVLLYLPCLWAVGCLWSHRRGWDLGAVEWAGPLVVVGGMVGAVTASW